MYLLPLISLVVFFFKQKTAYEVRISDWSSDVCSSDLEQAPCKQPVLGCLGYVAPARQRPLGDFEEALSGYAAYAPPSQRRVWGRWAEQDINGQIAQASHPHPQAVFGVPGDSEHDGVDVRSEEHTSELQSLMRTSYAVFCLKKKKN